MVTVPELVERERARARAFALAAERAGLERTFCLTFNTSGERSVVSRGRQGG